MASRIHDMTYYRVFYERWASPGLRRPVIYVLRPTLQSLHFAQVRTIIVDHLYACQTRLV